MRQAFAFAQDRKVLALAVQRGLLSAAQEQEVLVEQLDGAAPLREIVLARGLLSAAELGALEVELAAEDYARPPPARPRPPPPEVREAARDPARRLGEYVLVSSIGRGGGGEVWRAWDGPLNRWVAIKLASAPAGSQTALDRFGREAQAASRLDHPNIPSVFQSGDFEGRPFIVMPLSKGRPITEAGLPLPKALEAVRTAALALQHAHERDIVHRDVKPANILVDDEGRVLVIDFGLAFLSDRDTRLTTPGDVVGTAAYMSPEQARGDAAANHPASDIYSLGATLYELATGRPPFTSVSFATLIARVAESAPERPRRVQRGLGHELETVILTAMDPDPRGRYASAADFAEDLRRLLADEPIRARPVGPIRRLGRRLRRRPLRAALVLGGGLAIAAALAVGGMALARRGATLESIREMGALSLDAALQLRRAGDNQGMRRLVPRLRAAYDVAARRAPELAEVEYFMGRVYRALMDDEQALALQEKALAKDPAFAPALYERAVLLSRAYGRERERLVERGRTLEASPALAETLPGGDPPSEDFERARPGLERLRDAVLRDCAALERALGGPRGASGVSEAMVVAARGVLAHQQGRLAEARGLLERAVALDPGLEEAWEGLAQTASVEQRWDDAARTYGQAIERDRGYVPHRLGRSRVYMIRATTHDADPARARADLAAAIDDLTAALALDAGLADAWLRRGLARGNLAFLEPLPGADPRPLFEGAAKDLAEAERLGAPSVELHQARGILANYRGVYRVRTGGDPLEDLAAAEREFGAVRALLPGDAWPRLWLGYTHMMRGLHRALLREDALADFTAARENFAGATEVRSRRARVWEWLGFAATEQGRERAARGEDPSEAWQAAEQALDRAIASVAPPTWPLLRRAALSAQRAIAAGRGEPPEPHLARAEADVARALELEPGRAHGWLRRGILETERGRLLAQRGRSPRAAFAAAEAHFDRALEIEPRNAQALIERGRLLLLRGQSREKALSDLDRAVAIDPNYARRRAELVPGP